jgi:phosphate transport system substrate-binding protein
LFSGTPNNMLANRGKFRFQALTVISAVATAATAIALTVSPVKSQSPLTVKADGSSTVFPITEAVAEEFQNANRNIRVTVGISGTGGGFEKFCAGEIDIANASRKIKDAEKEACKQKGIEFIELPIAYDALTVVVSTQNTWVSSMTVEELKKMWEPAAEGTVKKWNQVRSSWPDKPLDLYGPGSDSGTFDYFTEKVNGKSGESRGDYTASEDDNVLVQGVSGSANALGYFGFAYYELNKDRLKAVAIDGGNGPVMPSMATVNNGTYKPLSRPIFIYVSKKSADRAEVKSFVEFYLSNASRLSAEVDYIALPAADYTNVQARFRNRTTGSVALREGL